MLGHTLACLLDHRFGLVWPKKISFWNFCHKLLALLAHGLGNNPCLWTCSSFPLATAPACSACSRSERSHWLPFASIRSHSYHYKHRPFNSHLKTSNWKLVHALNSWCTDKAPIRSHSNHYKRRPFWKLVLVLQKILMYKMFKVSSYFQKYQLPLAPIQTTANTVPFGLALNLIEN